MALGEMGRLRHKKCRRLIDRWNAVLTPRASRRIGYRSRSLCVKVAVLGLFVVPYRARHTCLARFSYYLH